jgi:hypothetical protein
MTQSPPPPVPPPYYPPAPRTNGLAIASLVLGVASLPGSFCCFCCFGLLFPPAVLAIVFGHVALSQIKQSQGQVNGRGMAVAGLVCGYLCLALHILWLLAWILLAAFGQDGHHGMWHFHHAWP